MVIAVGAASLFTVAALRDALLGNGFASWWVTAPSVLLALVSVLIALAPDPAFRGWRDVRRAVARGDVVAARVTRSGAQSQGLIAIGYACAQLIAVLAAPFLLANNQAVAKTFFLRALDGGDFSAGAQGLLDQHRTLPP